MSTEVSLHILVVSGDTSARVPLCASSCQQKGASLSLPHSDAALWEGGVGNQGALKSLALWIQAGRHLLAKLQERTSPKCWRFLLWLQTRCWRKIGNCLTKVADPSRLIYFPWCIHVSLYIQEENYKRWRVMLSSLTLKQCHVLNLSRQHYCSHSKSFSWQQIQKKYPLLGQKPEHTFGCPRWKSN